MRNNTFNDFLQNSKSIVGAVSTVIGFCIILNGLYELQSHQKLFENSDLNLPQSIEPFVKFMNNLTIKEKLSFGPPLFWFGSLLARSGLKKAVKSNFNYKI